MGSSKRTSARDRELTGEVLEAYSRGTLRVLSGYAKFALEVL